MEVNSLSRWRDLKVSFTPYLILIRKCRNHEDYIVAVNRQHNAIFSFHFSSLTCQCEECKPMSSSIKNLNWYHDYETERRIFYWYLGSCHRYSTIDGTIKFMLILCWLHIYWQQLVLTDAADQEHRLALIRELETLIHVGRHPNIVSLVGACTFEGIVLWSLKCTLIASLNARHRQFNLDISFAYLMVEDLLSIQSHISDVLVKRLLCNSFVDTPLVSQIFENLL